MNEGSRSVKAPARSASSTAAKAGAGGAERPSLNQSSGSYSIAVLNRAIDILAVFNHSRPNLSLREIVAAAKLPKTTVFRILSTLVERDLCSFDPETGEYSLGFAFLRYADIRRRQAKDRKSTRLNSSH